MSGDGTNVLRCAWTHRDLGMRCRRRAGHSGPCAGAWEPHPGFAPGMAIARVQWLTEAATGRFVVAVPYAVRFVDVNPATPDPDDPADPSRLNLKLDPPGDDGAPGAE
jgi:hypothetical protein